MCLIKLYHQQIKGSQFIVPPVQNHGIMPKIQTRIDLGALTLPIFVNKCDVRYSILYPNSNLSLGFTNTQCLVQATLLMLQSVCLFQFTSLVFYPPLFCGWLAIDDGWLSRCFVHPSVDPHFQWQKVSWETIANHAWCLDPFSPMFPRFSMPIFGKFLWWSQTECQNRMPESNVGIDVKI